MPAGPAISGVGGPFQLEDQDGKPVSDADMKGHPFLVFFGFTHCPDICPTTLFEISQVKAARQGRRPHRRAVHHRRSGARYAGALKDYLSNFDPHLRGLTGDPAAINAAIKAYRVYAKKVPLDNGDYTMDHTAVVYLMDKNGRFVAPFSTQPYARGGSGRLAALSLIRHAPASQRHHHRLDLGVKVEHFAALLAAPAGLPEAAERQCRVDRAVHIDADRAGPDLTTI